MTGLVLQLQSDAMDRTVKVTDLLRKTKAVAVKLALSDIISWVEQELGGYEDSECAPNYRHIAGKIKLLSPYHGWRPVIFEDTEFESKCSIFPICQSLGSLEDIAYRSKDGPGFLSYPLPGNVQQILARNVGIDTEYQMQFDVSQAFGVFDAVRNRVLDWALDLEQRGIVGHGMSFDTKEQEVAKSMAENNFYNIQNVGVLGNVTDSTVESTQTANYSPREISEIKAIMQQVNESVDQLDQERARAVLSNAQKIIDEADKTNPDSSVIRECLGSIRTICEGVSGNLVGAGLLSLISKFF